MSSTADEARNQKAVMTVIRDVSGSMSHPDLVKAVEEVLDDVMTPVERYLRSTYEDVEVEYVFHGGKPWRVDAYTFYDTEAYPAIPDFPEEEVHGNAGTLLSNPYMLAGGRFMDQYPDGEWDRYLFAIGDGEIGDITVDDRDHRGVASFLGSVDLTLNAYIQVEHLEYSRPSTYGDYLEEHSNDESVTALFPQRDGIAACRDTILEQIDL